MLVLFHDQQIASQHKGLHMGSTLGYCRYNKCGKAKQTA